MLGDNARWRERAERVAAKTYEFTAFLVRVLKTTIVGARKSRLATVLPPRHLAMVRAERIAPNFIAAMEIVRNKFGNDFPASITLVTVPSRTADIELSLTIGVHGQGEVVVLIVE